MPWTTVRAKATRAGRCLGIIADYKTQPSMCSRSARPPSTVNSDSEGEDVRGVVHRLNSGLRIKVRWLPELESVAARPATDAVPVLSAFGPDATRSTSPETWLTNCRWGSVRRDSWHAGGRISGQQGGFALGAARRVSQPSALLGIPAGCVGEPHAALGTGLGPRGRGRLRGAPPLAHPGPPQGDREGPRVAAASRCRFAAQPRARFRARDVMCLTSARDHYGGAASLSKEQFQSHLNLPGRSDGAYDSSEGAVGNCHRPTGDGHAEHR